MQITVNYLVLALALSATAGAMETCASNANARSSSVTPEEEWANTNSTYLLQRKVAELCATVPECKAQAETFGKYLEGKE